MPGTLPSAPCARLERRLHRLEVGAEDLQHHLAADAADGLFDVVLDRLREVEADARNLGQRRAHRLDEAVLRPARAATCPSAARWTNVSLMLTPSSSVPSSGRPCSLRVAEHLGERQQALAHFLQDLRRRDRARCSAASRRRSRCRPRRARGRNSLPSREPTSPRRRAGPRRRRARSRRRPNSHATSRAIARRASAEQLRLAHRRRPWAAGRARTARGRAVSANTSAPSSAKL